MKKDLTLIGVLVDRSGKPRVIPPTRGFSVP